MCHVFCATVAKFYIIFVEGFGQGAFLRPFFYWFYEVFFYISCLDALTS